MSATKVENLVTTREGDTIKMLKKSEWLIKSSSDTGSITGIAPGSVAYTADLSYMAMFDGENWVQIGG